MLCCTAWQNSSHTTTWMLQNQSCSRTCHCYPHTVRCSPPSLLFRPSPSANSPDHIEQGKHQKIATRTLPRLMQTGESHRFRFFFASPPSFPGPIRTSSPRITSNYATTHLPLLMQAECVDDSASELANTLSPQEPDVYILPPTPCKTQVHPALTFPLTPNHNVESSGAKHRKQRICRGSLRSTLCVGGRGVGESGVDLSFAGDGWTIFWFQRSASES